MCSQFRGFPHRYSDPSLQVCGEAEPPSTAAGTAERKTERWTETETNRYRDRQRYREMGQTETQKERHRQTQKERETHRKRERETEYNAGDGYLVGPCQDAP